ncbi:T9SS type A sorting domain-containing protein [Adhaeribacter aquaticus]|uniref:T9SS type A sorting domain-containing protein n=1 Tax=Adhaeribacter aquaticus TaxID=299567 RepID=UPI000403727C|nr:T9SS type A sorting domain-containing protein [Adhaeribacter aquaticus]
MIKTLPFSFKLLSLCLLLGGSITVSAQSIRHVSVTGTDTGKCPEGSPCATISYAVQVAAPGDVIKMAAGKYNQQATISKTLTLQGAGAGTDPAIHTIISGDSPALSGNGITLATNVPNITIKDIRLQNFSAGSGIYGNGLNNGISIEHVQVHNNLGGSSADAGIHLNGPISDVNLNYIDAQFNSTRGIVIWNGRKDRITITNSIVSNNSLSGLELQDGTASGVTIANNRIENNKDSGLSLVGLSAGAGANLISGNTLTNNGRFGIEVKLPNGTGQESGDGSIVFTNNQVERTTPIAANELRDLAGIAVYRRSWTNNNVDIPNGVVIKENIVKGYRQPSLSEGFGIVVEGTNMVVVDNTISDSDVAIQMQAGHLPYAAQTGTDGDQSNLEDQYFGRGNTPKSSGTINRNIFEGNTNDIRYVGLPAPPEHDRTWVGTTSTAWEDESNWQEGETPNEYTDVLVPEGSIYSPVISKNQSVSSLQIADGATLAVQEGSLKVKGNINNDGVLQQTGNGGVVFTGKQRQTLGGAKALILDNLEVGAAGLDLSGPVSIKKHLTVYGDLITHGQPLNLILDEEGAGSIIQSGQGKIEGLITMQRPSVPQAILNTGYDIISSPFGNVQYQDVLPLTSPEVPKAGEVFIFDESQITGTTSDITTFRQGWLSITNKKQEILPGTGLRIAADKIGLVSVTGSLRNGPVMVNNLGRGSNPQSGWHLLGNPYAAPLDWRLVQVPVGMNKALYSLGKSGHYESFVNGIGTAPQAYIIQPMQAFFVQVHKGPVNFVFDPIQQLTTELGGQNTPDTRPQLNLQISTDKKKDVTVIYFQEGATAQPESNFDAHKLPEIDQEHPIIYTKAGNENLSINGSSLLSPGQEVAIPLGVAGPQGKLLTLQINQLLNFDGKVNIILEDQQMGVYQDLRQNPNYTFTLNSHIAEGRFKVHFTTRNMAAFPAKTLENSISVFPNPTRSNVQVNLTGLGEEQQIGLVLYNDFGKMLINQQVPVKNGRVMETLKLNQFSKGIYMLHLRTLKGTVQRKIVLE